MPVGDHIRRPQGPARSHPFTTSGTTAPTQGAFSRLRHRSDSLQGGLDPRENLWKPVAANPCPGPWNPYIWGSGRKSTLYFVVVKGATDFFGRGVPGLEGRLRCTRPGVHG